MSLINKFKKFCSSLGLFDVKSKHEIDLNELIEEFKKKGYYVFENIIITKDNGTTAQIPLLLVGKYGLFCLEVKNYMGYINYDIRDDLWFHHIGEDTYSFYNPITQNDAIIYHLIKYVKGLLGKDIKSNVTSVIVFPDRCSVVNFASNNLVVTNYARLMENTEKYRKVCFTDAELNKVKIGLTNL